MDLSAFYENFLAVADICKEIAINNKNDTTLSVDDVENVVSLSSLVSKSFIVETFITKSYPYWKNIILRDKDFLVNNLEVIFGVNLPQIEEVKKLLRMNKVPDDLLDELWEYLDAMIVTSIKYIIDKRKTELFKPEITFDYDICEKFNIKF